MTRLLLDRVVVVVGNGRCIDLDMVKRADVIVACNRWQDTFARCGITRTPDVLFFGPGFPVDTASLCDRVAAVGYPVGRPESFPWPHVIRAAGAACLPYSSVHYRGRHPYGPLFDRDNELCADVGHPLTGCVAINRIVAYPIRHLLVTGFDLWAEVDEETGEVINVPTIRGGHDIERHLNWLAMERDGHPDGKVQYDRMLEDVLGM